MPSSYTRHARLLFVFSISAFVVTPLCAQRLDTDEMERSVWRTSYEAIDGSKVNAQLVLSGDTGYYEAGGSRGELSNVRYKHSETVKGNATITGNWSMGGVDGKFTFFVAGPGFSGAWQTGGKSGNWRGSFVSLLQQGGEVSYGPWAFDKNKGYYYRKCTFPAGGYQYVIFYKTKPNWVYWYNPGKEVFWCACPTVNHPKWGRKIRDGADLFLMASSKARKIEDCVFPDVEDDGANFVKGKTKDKDGSDVDLGCPPPDLP